MSHLKAGIKLLGDEVSMVRVELAVADHLATDVIVATIINIIVDRTSPALQETLMEEEM